MTFRMNFIGVIGAILLSAVGCGQDLQNESQASSEFHDSHEYEDVELYGEGLVSPLGCGKATASQLKRIQEGNRLKNEILQQCSRETGGSNWCSQIIRPNPASLNIFRCTYGQSVPHQLINPSRQTWKHAINAVRLIQELEQKGFRIKLIYNWWRPEPYNKNVGGAAGRHPTGTSVDVRFVSNDQADRAFLELCKFRKQGRIRAIGHYGTSALHFGVGDAVGNTWGKSCP